MLILVALFAFARPYIAAYSGPLLGVLLGALGALLLQRPLIWLGARCGLAITAGEATALCAALALGIVAKLGGLLYPDTSSSTSPGTSGGCAPSCSTTLARSTSHRTSPPARRSGASAC